MNDDATGSTSGKGLGLSLVRKFIELHAGTVELKSQIGRGTTVTCRIPTGSQDGFNKATSHMTSKAPLDNQFQASETKNTFILSKISEGKDSTSIRLYLEKITRFKPILCAANTFSLTPPTGKIFP